MTVTLFQEALASSPQLEVVASRLPDKNKQRIFVKKCIDLPRNIGFKIDSTISYFQSIKFCVMQEKI